MEIFIQIVQFILSLSLIIVLHELGHYLPAKYFKIINDLNSSLALKELSMGMSADYLDAVNHGATFVRIGSSIFGERS